jgi:hypothetical protein
MSKNTVMLSKPLKGSSLDLSSASIGDLSSSNLKISPANLQSLMSGTNLNNVIITNSEIDTTIIGANGASDAFFEQLTTYGDVVFQSADQTNSVSWNSAIGVLTVDGKMSVTCMTIGNLQICKNDISAINNNGSVNIIPDGIGVINLKGPVSNIVVSQGNYLTQLANGSVTFIASSSVSINSLSAGSSLTTFAPQNYTTVNGNINLKTDTGYYTNGNLQPKLITNINSVDANGIIIRTFTPSQVQIGDTITLADTNSVPNVNGDYLVTRIIDSNSFNISTGSNFPGFSSPGSIGTYGSLSKSANNSINLLASYSVNIPKNIPLIFGSTTASFNKDSYGNLITTNGLVNSITGTTSGMIINSQNNITFNVPSNLISNGNYSVILPQATHLQFGTSGSNFINYTIESNNLYDTNAVSSGGSWNTDTSATLAINSNNNISLNATNDLYVDVPYTYFQDQNPLIANYQQTFSDQTDRGIQFNYWSGSQTGGSAKLGWFGYKKSTGQFTFYQDAVNNNNIISGSLSAFAIGSINVNNISINSGGSLNVGCGDLLNVKNIFGCSGVLNINATSAINASTSNLNLNLSTAMNLPNNIPINLGTAGTYIKEATLGNLWLTASKNILLNTQTLGSVIIQPGVKVSFDGTSIGSRSISQGTSGNLRLDSIQNILLTVTAGNVVLPAGTSNTASSIQFGGTSETIYGSTSGIFLISNTISTGNINLIATSNVNMSTTQGNIQLVPSNGDINLFSSRGNVRLYQSSYLVFGISDTSNSIRQNSIGNLMINGPGTTSSTTNNTIEIKNASIIYLNATNSINTNTGVQLNLSSNNDRYLVTDSSGNFNINNFNFTSGSTINLRSNNTNIINTGGDTNINNVNTNISSGTTLNIITPNTFFNTDFFYLKDQVPLIANYLQIPGDQTDRGIQFNYYNTTKGSADLGWFGIKKNTMQFTYYQSAINTNDVITGTLGTFNLGSINVSNNISFLTSGNIDMSCGTISNLNTIIACKGVLNIMSTANVTVTSQNLLLNTGLVQLPYNTPISFNTQGSTFTSNSIVMSSNGNMTINVSGGSGTLILNSNVQINGTTNNVFSTITNYLDPILNIGSVSGTVPAGDFKDRGIQFTYYNVGSSTSNTGFFGFQNSTQRFVYYANATNSNEIITGSYGNVQFGNGFLSNLDMQCGTIANVSLLTACAGTGLTIQSSSGITISTNNVLMNTGSTISFGTTNQSISGTSNGNISINTPNNINLTSVSGGINLNTNTTGSGFVSISNNTNLYFGSTSSSNYINRDTSGNMNIINSTGNIYISPQTNSTSGPGKVILPTNDVLVFGNTQTSISSDGTNLQLNGYTVSINSTGPTVFNGTVTINGTLIATSTSISSDAYVYPVGTHNGTNITNISNSTSSGLVNITTSTANNAVIGQTMVITNSTVADGTFNVISVVNPTTFTISRGSVVTTTNLGNLKTSLNSTSSTGLEFDYWQNTGTTPNLSYQTGFLGLQAGSNTLVYYQQANVSNNIVTNGTLGNMSVNQLNSNFISGVSGNPLNLAGIFNTNTFLVQGSNFQIQGGSIDGTSIGQTTPANARFSNLTSSSSSNLASVTLTSTLNYSIDRIILSSLQPTANPNISKNVTFVTVQGNNFSSSGTLGTLGLTNDGQLKKIICMSCSSGGSYSLAIPNLIATNPLGGTSAKGIRFTRAGMSCELIWNAQGINSSTGCFEIIGGLAYVF